MAGLDILSQCASLDEAIETAAKSPVSRYHPMEIRPFAEGLLGVRRRLRSPGRTTRRAPGRRRACGWAERPRRHWTTRR